MLMREDLYAQIEIARIRPGTSVKVSVPLAKSCGAAKTREVTKPAETNAS